MLSDETIDALKAQHGRIEHVTYNGVDIVFRKPTRPECQQYMIKRDAGGAEKVTADEQLAQWLVVQCGDIVMPAAKKAFLELLEEWPLLCNESHVASALARLAGVVQTDALKNAGNSSRPSAVPPKSMRAV